MCRYKSTVPPYDGSAQAVVIVLVLQSKRHSLEYYLLLLLPHRSGGELALHLGLLLDHHSAVRRRLSELQPQVVAEHLEYLSLRGVEAERAPVVLHQPAALLESESVL